MPYKKWQEVERRYGKPMNAVLTDLYAKYGNHNAVADELGVTLKGLRDWRNAAGCVPVRVVRVDCGTSQGASGK